MIDPRYRWECVTEKAAFPPRDGAGALSWQGKMFLIGGWNKRDKTNFPRICSNDVWVSSDGKDWVCIKPNTFGTPAFDPERDWEGRHTAGYAVFKGRIWIICGDCNQGHYQYDIWNSEDGVNWMRVNRGISVPWMPRALQHTVVFDGAIWVMGGQTMPGFVVDIPDEAFYNDIWRTNDGVNWEKVEPRGEIWSPRGMIGGSAVLHGRMWIMGGGTYDTPRTPTRKFYNDVWSTADGISWTCHTSSAAWVPRQYHDVAAWDDKLWVLEGYNKAFGGNRNDVWYSSDGVNWTEVPDTPWKPRHAASVFVHDDALWVVAGNNMESDVWKLTKCSPSA